jgi:F0F1-type ATP synthase assembly protein I
MQRLYEYITMFLIAKYLITAAVILLVSEFAKRNEQMGALIASVPLVTFMVLIWLHLEKQPAEKISNYSYYTFWYVIPTLPMFLVFPYLHQHYGFWPALGSCTLLTVILFWLWALTVKPFGINLL